MKKQLVVSTKGNTHSYSIRFDNLSSAPGHIRALAEASGSASKGLLIVSDRTVWPLYGEALREGLRDCGFSVSVHLVEAGEASKSLTCLAAVWEAMAGAQLTRHSLVVALGGGVVGDLAGFAASTWMRGIACIQIPTTLLAQVDSSVGGKTAIDLPQGKNLAGTFWQPSLVLIDSATLATLPRREFTAGMAEVIKYGAVLDAELFALLERESVKPENLELLDRIIHRCCQIKAEITGEDERDLTGRRAILNFGHSFGHALETSSLDTSGLETSSTAYHHGEAVGAGMRIATAFSLSLGVTAMEDARRLKQVLDAYHLPVASDLEKEKIINIMRHDKKGIEGGLELILMERIGKAIIRRTTWPELGLNLDDRAGSSKRSRR
jgi:3-dehydroquinate synthase